jgi:hypothetical protein
MTDWRLGWLVVMRRWPRWSSEWRKTCLLPAPSLNALAAQTGSLAEYERRRAGIQSATTSFQNSTD